MITSSGGQRDSEGAFKDLDLSSIQYPSDDLSIGVLRKEHPALFDIGFSASGDNAQPQFFFKSRHGGHAEDQLAHMLYCERLIAVSAYADTKGIDGLNNEFADVKEEVTGLYRQYKIASGIHHAEQLIRDIERQAVQLAKEHNL